ncbi:protein-L-isoaspartate methyltransferase 2 [Planoprotostelium fungivorum]|uniref:protein-L-isoaspartate(D-aspartate) O-methyltransferase n=1 Tax=Planoprotostelium fungivorum TaxID=1890364 RepID=A0A2P6MRM3_9EUKA|nr:protein-L-isoaspartate methyltransferase 2 [Planoprotostelium fungivorum]
MLARLLSFALDAQVCTPDPKKRKAKTNESLINGLHGQMQPLRIISHIYRNCYYVVVTRSGLYSADPSEAYNDNPHPIGHRATISAPHMHAYCLDLLESRLTPGSTALDVGCGSGYLSACMSRMMGSEGKVIGIDYIPQLVRMSEENVRKDDPSLLDQQQIIFKSIHVGAAASMVPEELLKQLKPGGLMVIPVGDQEQILMKYTKDNNGSIEKSTLMGVRYVPLAWRAKASFIYPGRVLKESEYDASVEHTTYCINVARYELPLSLCSRESLDRLLSSYSEDTTPAVIIEGVTNSDLAARQDAFKTVERYRQPLLSVYEIFHIFRTNFDLRTNAGRPNRVTILWTGVIAEQAEGAVAKRKIKLSIVRVNSCRMSIGEDVEVRTDMTK